MYGHPDKQPEFSGWRSDPALDAQDRTTTSSMAVAAPTMVTRSTPAIAAIQALKRAGACTRIVGLIETCEESGSGDPLPYVDMLRDRLGDVGLVVCPTPAPATMTSCG